MMPAFRQVPRPSDEETLGAPTDTFGVSRAWLLKMGAMLALLLVVGVALLVLGVVGYSDDSSYTTELILGTPLRAELSGGLCLFAGIVGFVRVVRRRGERVTLHGEGIVHARGGGSDVLLWTDVARWKTRVARTRVNGISTGTQHLYTLEAADGRRVVLTESLERIDLLQRVIGAELMTRLLPRARAAFAAGEPQVFGPLVLSAKGLSFKTRELAWPDFLGARVRDGSIFVVGRKGAWPAVPYDRVWNAPVLLALCEPMETKTASRS